ncbi:MAG: glycosyltransferase [Ignavibacteria bacterium]|nr:glycosyltransferase [Ignavibacteria bacterium]
MKIIYIGTAYPMRGGIAHFNTILFNYLAKDNDVKIYSFKRQYPEFLFPGKTQYETEEPTLKIPTDKNIISIDSINPFNWIKYGLKIRKEKPDLLILKYWIPFFAPCYFTICLIAKVFRRTNVLFICDNVIPHEKRIGDKLLTKIAFSIVDYFIVMSKTVEEDLIKVNKKRKPYLLTPHPIYNHFGDKVTKEEAKNFILEKYNFDFRNKKLILFFGYIRRYKGLLYLLEAMHNLKTNTDINLLVAGEFYEDSTPYIEKIKSHSLDDRVKLINEFIPDCNVRYLFSACDCLVLPYSNATQSGIVQIAYYYDKPVIVTNVGGLSEVVINEKTGLIVESENPKLISDAILKFYNENLENSLVENIKVEKTKYSWEYFVYNLYKLIKDKDAI